MKKLVVSLLTLLACGSAYALPVGNPAEASLFLSSTWWGRGSGLFGLGGPGPGLGLDGGCCGPCDPCCGFDWGFRFGFYGDYVFQRHLKVEHNNLGIPNRRLRDVRLNTNAGYLALNFCNVVDVFGTLGGTHFRIEADDIAFNAVDTGLTVIDFSTRFSWSVGARATLFEWCCFLLGIEGQYFQSEPRVNFILTDAAIFTYPERACTRYQEAQVGFGIAYRYCCQCTSFVPYVAAKWSWERWRLRNREFIVAGVTYVLPELRNAKHWGFATGITTTLCDMIGVTVEGRWGDEKAIYVNGQLRF
jgi:hypothetical protein